MTDPDAVLGLADYLQRAPILHAGTFAIQGASRNYLVILEGGVGALAKPEDENNPLWVRREVAAWEVARLLGWPDMVSATVLRSVSSFHASGVTTASLQVLWPENEPDVDPGFPNEDIRRAAVFDAVVKQTDRDGHNWLSVPASGPHRLKLVDHAYAFEAQIEPPSSTFFNRCRGEHLDDVLRGALEQLARGLAASPVPSLLPQDAVDAVSERARRLLVSGRIELP